MVHRPNFWESGGGDSPCLLRREVSGRSSNDFNGWRHHENAPHPLLPPPRTKELVQRVLNVSLARLLHRSSANIDEMTPFTCQNPEGAIHEIVLTVWFYILVILTFHPLISS